jgi:hypothetical protein
MSRSPRPCRTKPLRETVPIACDRQQIARHPRDVALDAIPVARDIVPIARKRRDVVGQWKTALVALRACCASP